MAPSSLQGLNIVHTVPPPNPYLSDADLLSVPHFPDLNAQLDLWTNLNFQSDEPLIPRHDDGVKKDHLKSESKRRDVEEGSEEDLDRYNDHDDDVHSRGAIAETNAHENVVTGTVLPPTGVAHPAGTPGMPMDISSLLASFGIDPFSAPPVQPQLAVSSTSSLAQLLTMHAASFRGAPPQAQSPLSPQTPTSPSQHHFEHSAAPTPKRARTRSSVSSADGSLAEAKAALEAEEKSDSPLNAAEDKRRRNTAASARFRLKKKEREAALERKAKELELRVGELEKECEALRRENGWLKGLVVGVTGAGAVQHQQIPQTGAVGTGKRARDEADTQAGGQ